MKNNGPKLERAARTGSFVLTSERGEAISAVEGLTLSPRMAIALGRSAAQNLSGDERRALIREILRKK